MVQNLEYLVPIVLFLTIGSIISLVFYFAFAPAGKSARWPDNPQVR